MAMTLYEALESLARDWTENVRRLMADGLTREQAEAAVADHATQTFFPDLHEHWREVVSAGKAADEQPQPVFKLHIIRNGNCIRCHMWKGFAKRRSCI